MKRSSNARTWLGGLSTLLVGFTLLGAAGCGEEADTVETTGGAIQGGWTTLQLINGWQSFWASPYLPAVGMVNGVTRFRGALKAGPSGVTSNVAFNMPAGFTDGEALDMRTILSGAVGGTVAYQNVTNSVSIWQDGLTPSGAGPAAKAFTSLEGISFDKVEGTSLNYAPGWEPLYPYRRNDSNGAYVKTVDGFVRFQGFLMWLGDPYNFDGFLFNIPSQFRPGQTVFVPANLGGRSSEQSWGQFAIYSNGDVYVNIDPFSAAQSVSLENVSFSLTNSGNITLPLMNHWVPFSPRAVKVGKWTQDVVRLQGAIAGGDNTIFATLPVGYRPARTVYLVAAANGPVPARIMIGTNGVMQFDLAPLSAATVTLSLDGLSFGL